MKKAWFFAAAIVGWAILSSISLGYYGGDGTSGNPYQIADANDLLELATDMGNYDKCFILTADIDLGGQIFMSAIIAPDIDNDAGFFQGTPFTGTMDGNGHEITNFTVNGENKDFLGLFGFVDSEGQIKNLSLTDVDITGNGFVGSLCGYNNSGIISGCYTTGVISGRYHIGGLCGWNEKGTIIACYAASTVNGYEDVGGLCGWNKEGSISVSYAAGAVSGTNNIGGLCGYSFGEISACYATGTVSGGDNVGGLCGWNFGTISACYATGVISGSSHTGGFCGRNDWVAFIVNSFWDVETSGLTFSSGGEGKTTVEMQTLSTFTDAGWDFSSTDGDIADWFMSGNECPHLTSETTVVVPNFVGQIFSGVETMLREMGLRFEITCFVSDTVPAGIVAHQSPTAGQQAIGGSIVNLLVSIGKPYSSGSGTELDPYQIATRGDLQTMAVTTTDYNKHFVLTADIDMEGQTFATAIIAPDTNNSNFEFDGTAFTGTFDGNGYRITNFTITGVSNLYIGLIGYIGSGGQLKNLGIVNADIQGGDFVGGLCGMNEEGTIIACYTTIAVSGNSVVGGLCGRNSCTVSASYATGTVSGASSIGGLCGENVFGGISACYVTSAVGGDNTIGGLCGHNVYGYIGYCYAGGAVSGSFNVGGLIGSNYSSNVDSSFWDVETSGLTISAGGEGKTTVQMKTQTTFTDAGWDFTNETANGTNDVWRMCTDGVIYPRLNWQSVESDLQCPNGVGAEDLDYFIGRWLMQNCAAANGCAGADIDTSGQVDLADFVILAQHWLSGV